MGPSAAPHDTDGDLIAVIEALDLDRPVVAGYDWGGRAATITAMLRRDLITGLVSVDGYNLPFPPHLAD